MKPLDESTDGGCIYWEDEVEREFCNLQESFKRVMKFLQERSATLQDDVKRFEEERKRTAALEVQKCCHQEDAKIKLDVGGRQFETTVQTLTNEPGSMLEAMFSGRFALQPEVDKTIFLDRDPTYFATILNYLRDKGKNKELQTFCDIHTINGRERLRLLREVTYYGIESLKQMLEQPTLIVSQDQILLEQINDESMQNNNDIYFTNIQDAINAAEKGHRIVVCAGVYTETLTIDKSITICGHPTMEHVVIRSHENVVVSSARNAILRNLTLRQLGGKFNGLLVYEGMLTVECCDISSAGLGCFAVRSAHAILRNNKIHDSPQGGMVFCEGAEGLVESNQIYANGLQGIEVREASKPFVTRNHIYNSDQNGILIHSKGKGEFQHNEIYNNKIDGIMVISEASPSSIQNNHIHHNRQRGIFISRDSCSNGINPDANIIQHNTVNVMKEQ